MRHSHSPDRPWFSLCSRGLLLFSDTFTAMFTVKICFVLFLTGSMNGAESMTHTLMEFWTYSCEVPNFPAFVSVGVFNGQTLYQYDSVSRRTHFKKEWMKRLIEENPKILEWRTQRDTFREQIEKNDIELYKQRLNQTDGLHILQSMAGCQWNDETGEIRGFYQTAFDGQDYYSLDWDTQTWVAAKSQAFASKLWLEKNQIALEVKSEVNNICAHYLKKFVHFGEEDIKRKELPRVWLLQKSSWAPVTCFASGFYPDRARLFWAKDGAELGAEPEEILPNHDGTFQTSASLDLSSVPSGDWGRYSCVFQLSGVPEDLITKLDPGQIRTNEKKLLPIILAASGALAGTVVVVVVILYQKRKSNNVL